MKEIRLKTQLSGDRVSESLLKVQIRLFRMSLYKATNEV